MAYPISFFSRPTLVIKDKENKDLLFRISGTVRGKQIADYLGGKYNPTEGWQDDTLVYLKPRSLSYVKDGDYVDILDNKPEAARLLGARPGINVIAMTTPHAEWLRSFLPNKVIIIPHAHVNFERVKRTRKKVLTCGYIGALSPYHIEINKKVRDALKGFKFIGLFNFTTRKEIIDFYKKIDIQVIGYFDFIKDCPYYHEKKIVDAMSFGIPTIAGYKLGYKDIEDFYIKVSNLDELVKEAEKLRGGWNAKRLIKKSEAYHISNISKLYKKL